MFIILLKFSNNKSQAGQFMDGHNAWIQRGVDDGVFLLVGSIRPALGGAILAHHCSKEQLQQRINADPFIIEDVVSADIIEIAANRADDRLQFLLE